MLASRLARIAAPIDGVTVQLDDPGASHDDRRRAELELAGSVPRKLFVKD
ncbi:hypothetical protein [Paracoccus mutanolyticus]|nr:hypothetical protein [Paracoccus mutanolyticus]